MIIRLLGLLVFLCPTIAAQDGITGSTDQYVIQFSASNPRLVTINAHITLADSLLYMSAYGPVPDKWPKYVTDLSITDEGGIEVNFEHRDSTVWLIKKLGRGNKVTLHYTVVLDHENEKWPGGIDGVAFVRDWGIMASGRALFIMNGDSAKTDIRVTLKAPQRWKVTAPWTQIDSDLHIYNVQNHLQLQEALLFAGTHEEENLMRNGFKLKFALGGNTIASNKDEYIQRAGAVLDYYIAMMGGIPKPEPGNDLSTVVVIINESEEIDGEVIGNHISLFMNPHAEPQGQMIGWFMFAHEFFHLWNGKSLQFQGTQADWFKEGVSNYYTLKALRHAAFIGEAEITMALNNLFYDRYINDSGFGHLAPSDAASGFDKDNHWGLIYGGGLFAGICMDMEIRHNSNNSRSLDDLMRQFYREYAGSNRTISNDDILQKVNSLANSDMTEFMDTFIRGTEEVPLQDYLKYAGVSVTKTNGQLSLIHNDDKSVLEHELWSGFTGQN